MVHWFADNVVLTFIVIVGIGMLLTRGVGGSFFGRLLFVLIGGFVVLSLLVAFLQGMEAKYNEFKGDMVGFLEDRACAKFEMIEKVCMFFDMAQAKEREKERLMTCADNVLQKDSANGGKAILQTCNGLRGTGEDADRWEECVKREAHKYQIVDDDLITSCPAFAPPTSLMHDLIEGFACPLGIKWWCTTQPGKTDQPAQQPQQQAPAPDVRCLEQVTSGLNARYRGIYSPACIEKASAPEQVACYVQQLNSKLSRDDAQAWVDQCTPKPSM